MLLQFIWMHFLLSEMKGKWHYVVSFHNLNTALSLLFELLQKVLLACNKLELAHIAVS